MAKILHLIPDEKITDNVIENFEKVFNDNIFFVLGNNENRKHCKTVGENVICGNEQLFVKENVKQDVKGIVVHGLNYIFSKLILDVDKNIAVAWFAWGFDVYNLPKISETLYARDTFTYLKNSDAKFTIINKIKKHRIIRSLYYKYVNKTDDYYSVYELAHKRIDYFCTYIKEDYDLFQNYYPNKLKYIEIGYFSIDQYLAGQPNLRISSIAKNILVGNSNSVENNHLDVFKTLNEIDFKGKVIVPLSYGNDTKYKKIVIENGNKLLKDKFQPLLDFMQRDEYLKILSECSAAIFYHYRQQAMGNILALLYMGVRIYLSKNNPVYHYLKRNGIIVFDFDKDFVIYTNTILEQDSQDINRKILDTLFNEELLFLQYTNLVNKLVDVNR